MKLHRVSILNDYPEYRGSFILSTASGEMAFLGEDRKLHHLDRTAAAAILCLFDALNDRAVESISMVRWLALTKEAKKIFEKEAA